MGKLENIMFNIDTSTPYIGDFGACYYFKDSEKCSSVRGTDAYRPPEYAKKYSFDARKSDIYSLGVTLHAMLTKIYPYNINKELGKRKIIIDDQLSDDCKNLLKKMLKTNPKKRISLDEIMKHPWLTNIKKESKLQKVNQSINKCVGGILCLSPRRLTDPKIPLFLHEGQFLRKKTKSENRFWFCLLPLRVWKALDSD